MEGSKIVIALFAAVMLLWVAIAVVAATYDPATGGKRPMKERLFLLLAYLPIPWPF